MVYASCHVGRKHKALGLCNPCYQAKRTADGYKPKINRTKHAAASKKWSKSNKTELHLKWVRAAYGLSPADYEALMAVQQGLCAMCGKLPVFDARRKRLCVDHDHGSGKVRGLLCHPCNIFLGFLEKRWHLFPRVMRYLKLNPEHLL